MATETLLLEVQDFVDPTRWRWVLKEPGGKFLADHPVALRQEEPEYAALLDLPGWLWHHAAPDRWAQDERQLLARVGAWIGERVFGPVGETILRHGRPAAPRVVQVQVPLPAEGLLLYPLEIAHVRGRPLALHKVSLVYQVVGEAAGGEPAPVGDRLRLLALFSLPPKTGALNLRRERQMLKRLVGELTGASGRAIELRVLQYGVTRHLLEEALQEGDGWDVIHFSGHGLEGGLVLEKPDGSYDLIPSADLAELLVLAGGRLKLVMLSACLSAAASLTETRRWLGLDLAPNRDTATSVTEAAATGSKAAPTVARALVQRLDCVVLAMRYTVEDEFATDFACLLYDKLFEKGQDLPRATQLALAEATGNGESTAVGALSLATPAMFGNRAADLRLVPPEAATTGFAVPETGVFGFPPEPPHFVGRVAAMTRASAALAAAGSRRGVLFYGMAGAGKTSCAVELTYHHEAARRFRAFAWYQAPEAGKDIALALRDYALALERQVPGLEMVHVVDRIEELKARGCRGYRPC